MSTYRLGAAMVDPAARMITINGESRRLSLKAMSVLEALVEANGDVITRDQLISRVWPDVCVGEEVLTQAIAELRRAFGDNPRTPANIVTVPNTGYRLAASLTNDRTREILLPPSFECNTENSIEAITACFAAFDAFERGGRDSIDVAIEQCRTSIEYDSTFAPAHAQLSAALVYKHLYYGTAPGLLEEALKAAQTTIHCDRGAPEGYAAQGFALAYLGDLDHAITSYKAALRLRNDCYLVMLSFGRVLFVHGYAGAAERVFERGAQIRGDEYQCLMLSAAMTKATGDTRRAAAKLRQVALRSEQHALEQPATLRGLTCRTYSQIAGGGVASAEPLLARLEDNHDPLTYYIVGALARAGEKALAIDRFEAIVDNGWADPYFLNSDRDLDPLRGEPRFQKIANTLAA